MTERSIPHTGKTQGDAGPYSSSDWARVWRTSFQGLQRDNASVIYDTGNGTDEALWVEETAPASTQVQVNIGNAYVKGYWYQTDAIVNVQIAPNTDASGDDRIDLIVLRLDITNQDVRIEILEGTVAPVPVAPSVTQNATIWEVPIAEIAVANGFTSIVDADIDNTVREYAYLWPVQMGGTGLVTHDIRQLMIGNNDGSGTLEQFIQKAAYINLSNNTSSITTGSWQSFDNLQELYDFDNLITVSGSNITIAEKGFYLVDADILALNQAAGNSRLALAIYNSTQAIRRLFRHVLVNASSTSETSLSAFFQANAGDVINLQGYSSANNMRLNIDATSFGGEASSSTGWRIFKLTNEEV